MIGDNIKKKRQDAKLTQKELADKMNVSFQTISKWENGINEPDLETLKQMCSLFNCSLDELINIKKSETLSVTESNVNFMVSTLIKRAKYFIEDKDITNANSCLERALDIDPENSQIYFLKFLLSYNILSINEFKNYKKMINLNNSYLEKAIKFATPEYKAEIEDLLKQQYDNLKEYAYNKKYEEAIKFLEYNRTYEIEEALLIFKKLKDYKDSQEKIKICYDKLKKIKKSNKKTAIIFLLILSLILSAILIPYCITNYNDKKERNNCILNSIGEEYAVTGIDNTNIKEIIIPTSYKGKPVTKINANAFNNCKNLTKVVINDNITQIGESVFNGCSSLKEITLPLVAYSTHIGYYFGSINYDESYMVESIDNRYYIPKSLEIINIIGGRESNAYFKDLTSLKKISITGIEKIKASSMFTGCSSLEELELPNVDNTEGLRFSGNNFTYYYKPFGYFFGDKEYDNSTKIVQTVYTIDNKTESTSKLVAYIPKSLKVLKINGKFQNKYVLSNFKYLEKVVLPNENTLIEEYAFLGCSSLQDIEIPTNILKINSYAFKDCTSLTNVTIGENVNYIGKYAFYNCYNLSEVTFKNINGWYKYKQSSKSDKTTISNTILQDKNNNATKLKKTFIDYYWERD